MAVGWLSNTAEADTYFLTERLTSTAWDSLTAVSGGRDQKTAVLLMAYNRLRYCGNYTIPAPPTAAQLAKLKMAQLETAYYMALHISDEDRRKGVHAQGVTDMGIVKEVADLSKLDELPFPPIVKKLMADFDDTKPFYAVDIDRDEDESVNTDVTED